MNNYNSERQRSEIVLVFESPVGGDEYIALQLLHQYMIFQMLPAEIEERPHLMVRERFNQQRIDAGVYDDAHAS